MEASSVQSFFSTRSEEFPAQENEAPETLERPSVLSWYRILRTHYQWPLFEAIRYALLLSR